MKCMYCKKRIWPWQKRYLGFFPSHMICDQVDFEIFLQKMVIRGVYTEKEADYQKTMRNINAYSR